MNRTLSLASSSLALGMLMAVPSAQAHIKMEGALRSRTPDGVLPGLDDAQKMFPCDGQRSAGPVYTFQPGTTITLSISETVPHPSYFRIAFDNDGENDFKEPASIMPIDPKRACPFDKDDQCGKSDFCNVYDPNGPRVLWDNLNPHASGGSNYSWNVKLPDIECENCTLQVIQVMEDTVHGAYCPQGSCANSGDSLEDIYHRCINIKLKKGATNSPGVATGPVNNKGIECSQQGGNTGPAPQDGGVASDAGTVTPDAGVRVDSGAPSGTGGVGGTGGTGSTGSVGGTTTPTGPASGGAAGGTSGSGTPPAGNVGNTGSPSSPAAGGDAAVATGGTAAGSSSGFTGGTNPTTTNDDGDGGCSVTPGARGARPAGALVLSVLGMIALKRRRQRRA